MRNLKTFYTTGQIPEEGTANLTNFTKLGKYTFVSNLFEKIILGDSIAEIPLYCFGNNQNTSVLKSVEIPASVTNIADYAFAQAKNLVYIKFNNDNFTYQANSFAGMAARATIIAPEGSKGESLATELGVQFIDSAEAPEIVAYYTNDNSVLLLAKIDDSNYTAFCTGSATYFNMGYTDYYKAVESKDGSNGPNRVWDDYKSLITKAVYVNPNFTKIDSSFAKHASLKTVELPASVTTITESCFNQSGLTTLYVTGNEMVESVVDLRNVTSIGGMAMAGCQAKNILLSDDLTGTWGNNMFWNCSNLTYIRIPKGVTGAQDDPFNTNTVSLTTVLVENSDFEFSDGMFEDSINLSTIIGYKNSKAEEYATSKGLTFIPIDAAGVLNFDGFQVKKSGTNGLRSLYTANLTKMETYEDAGFRVVEFGSILASTAKLTAAGESNLTIYKNENGEYKSSSFAFVYPIYQNGSRTNNKIIKDTPAGVNAETGEKIDHTVEYACTVTEFNETNYNMEVISRGYVVYADAEGNEYIVYADLYDDDGNNADPVTGKLYNSTTLKIVCTELLEAGLIDNTYISWIDVQNFKNVTTVTAS
ncbi:MAG: leucine-rich repeat protein [Clostridia bacterium]|nr:leucine-rich repeat protein [Clostridia bacterium]